MVREDGANGFIGSVLTLALKHLLCCSRSSLSVRTSGADLGFGFHRVKGLQQFIHCGLAFTLRQAAAAQHVQCVNEGLVQHMPIAGGARRDARFGRVLGRLQILHTVFAGGQIIFLNEPADVCRDAAKLC
jgi:hypothetical protein